MNGLFPHFRIPDNCEAQDLDCTWSDMLTPTPKSGPALPDSAPGTRTGVQEQRTAPWPAAGATAIKRGVVQRNDT